MLAYTAIRCRNQAVVDDGLTCLKLAIGYIVVCIARRLCQRRFFETLQRPMDILKEASIQAIAPSLQKSITYVIIPFLRSLVKPFTSFDCQGIVVCGPVDVRCMACASDGERCVEVREVLTKSPSSSLTTSGADHICRYYQDWTNWVGRCQRLALTIQDVNKNGRAFAHQVSATVQFALRFGTVTHAKLYLERSLQTCLVLQIANAVNCRR